MPKNTIILNDTSRNTDHVGCLTVMKSMTDLLNTAGYSVDYYIQSINENFDEEVFSYLSRDSDYIFVNGEGTLHHDAGLGLLKRCKYAKNQGKKTILMNTVWQENIKNKDYLKYFDYITTRESFSNEQILSDGSKSIILPDLSILHIINNYTSKKQIQKIKHIALTDSVYIDKSTASLNYAFKNNLDYLYMCNYRFKKAKENQPKSVRDSSDFQEFTKTRARLVKDINMLKDYDLVVTGRFHIMCMSIALSIPFYVFKSNTYKIEGTLRDSEMKHLLIDDIQNADLSSFNFTRFYKKIDRYKAKANELRSKVIFDLGKL